MTVRGQQSRKRGRRESGGSGPSISGSAHGKCQQERMQTRYSGAIPKVIDADTWPIVASRGPSLATLSPTPRAHSRLVGTGADLRRRRRTRWHEGCFGSAKPRGSGHLSEGMARRLDAEPSTKAKREQSSEDPSTGGSRTGDHRAVCPSRGMCARRSSVTGRGVPLLGSGRP